MQKRDLVGYLVELHQFSVRKATDCLGLARSAWYRPVINRMERDKQLIDALNKLAAENPALGFWDLFRSLRQQGHTWNHKRVYRVYRQLGMNKRRSVQKTDFSTELFSSSVQLQ